MNNHLVQLGELIPIKGLFYRVVDVVGQYKGFPETMVLAPYSQTMSSIKRGIKRHRRGKK